MHASQLHLNRWQCRRSVEQTDRLCENARGSVQVVSSAIPAQETDASLIEVRTDSHRTLDDDAIDAPTYSSEPRSLPSLGEESLFGAFEGDGTQQSQEMMDRSNKCKVTDVSDVTQDYGYKYEYTQDEEEDDDDDERYLSGNESTITKVQGVVTSLVPNQKSALQNNNSTIHLLGRAYHPILDYEDRRSYESSLFWWTYRHDFPEIVPYKITTDAGWGCMLRSAQMMLAQVLRLHYQDRKWRPPQSFDKRRLDPFVQKILTWFADFPSQSQCRYSLHNMVAAGLSRYETLPGEWYGPGTACYVLRDLCRIHERQESNNDRLMPNSYSIGDLNRPMFRVYVASQGCVYRDAVEDLMTRDGRKIQTSECNDTTTTTANEEPNDPLFHPLDPRYDEQETIDMLEWDTAGLLLVPLRLGLKSFNEAYTESLAHVFSFRQCVGVLGGRPRSARWFYAASSDGATWYGLDPHTVQSAPQQRKDQDGTVRVALTEEYIRSVHCDNPATIPLTRSDPSLALGFYCSNRSDFEDLCRSLHDWTKSHSGPDLFSVADAVPDYSANVSSVMNEMMLSGVSLSKGERLNVSYAGNEFDDTDANDDGGVSDEDEYVML